MMRAYACTVGDRITRSRVRSIERLAVAAVVIVNDDSDGDIDDDFDDEFDADNGETVFDLARRTGKIIDLYREYITEIGTSVRAQ